MRIQHPTSGVEKPAIGSLHRLWCFLLGPIYYLAKGAYGWALISLLTANGLVIGFPLYNKTILRSHFEGTGWRVLP